ncbi:hypothetical protein EDEG_03399 [Edhazardia aedis USNM 41457]|uniref:AAA+ ATPase domain-containing protein n=1 Tax=Edhazardia aedis (strain USNM 41457) TaxID=1003232 RepID=J9DHR4_EDHAE|nr:hypothetical protein EDEG_03399 [Edhazardia aedis USNM 41457]|eukprot:EJW02155.1 hypothetical protein EDEG_03399 [Edhazardia aedis USNM 41457]
MLWVEKYRPKSFDETKYHTNLVEILKSYSLKSVPHLLVHGGPGHGKKTLIQNFINNIHQREIKTSVKLSKIQGASSEIEISYLESEELIEITPGDYGYQDKLVIQGLIKSLAQTKPIIQMMMKDSKKDIRFIVINDADELSKDAQAALRRTVERYSTNFRLIMICEEMNTIIEPLRSRCLLIRVPGFSELEIEDFLKDILIREQSTIDHKTMLDIIKAARGSMRKALCLAENFALFAQSDDNKRSKRLKAAENPYIFLEYEKIINSIVFDIKKNPGSNTIYSIRKDLYTLISGCIPPKMILRAMIKRLIAESRTFESVRKICEYGSLYDERMKMGSKEIIHLEAFVVSVMSIYY